MTQLYRLLVCTGSMLNKSQHLISNLITLHTKSKYGKLLITNNHVANVLSAVVLQFCVFYVCFMDHVETIGLIAF